MLQKSDVEQVLAAEHRRSNTSRAATIAVIVVIVMVLAATGWFWWSTSWSTSPSTYSTALVSRQDIRVTLTATGTLQPTAEIAVTSGASGTIQTVDVDFNDAVVKGQVLARLDTTNLEAALQRAWAMVDLQSANRTAAAASLSDAETALARAVELQVGVTIAARDLELARTALERAKASLLASEAQLRAAEADVAGAKAKLGEATIVAPIDGVVLDVNAKVGQWIGTSTLGQTLFVVASDLKQLDLAIDIDEADVGRVQPGDKTTFTVEAAPDQPFSGIVRQVRSAPANSDGVVSYKTLVRIDNEALTLRPGMTATAEVVVADAANVLTVPNAALRFTPPGEDVRGASARADDEQAVWVLKEGVPTRIAVQSGLTDGISTEISSNEVLEGEAVLIGSGD